MQKIFPKIVSAMNIVVIIGSVFIVLVVSYDFFNNLSLVRSEASWLHTQLIVCILFLVDYLVRFLVSEHKLRFFGRNLLLLLISIPYLNLVSFYDVNLDQEWLTMVRILPVIRGGYAIAIVISRTKNGIVSTLITSYIIFVTLISYFVTMIFFYAEKGLNPMVHDYGDALWWTCMNLTTVGSNIFAVTPLGKILSVVVAAMGMMMFPIFTAYITEIFQNYHKKRHTPSKKV